MILSLVQTKGGTAKSTLSQCLAFALPIRKTFERIALVELDVQGTLQRWWQRRIENNRNNFNVDFFHIPASEPAEVQTAMEPIASQYDLVIMDVPGESVSRFHTSFACVLSDMVLIPMRTSTNDEDAFEANLLPILARSLEKYPEKDGSFFVLPTFTHPNANAANIVGYFDDILPDYIQCLDAVFPFRAVFENCNRRGLHIFEFARLVRTNRRDYTQAHKAEKDVLAISKRVLEGAL